MTRTAPRQLVKYLPGPVQPMFGPRTTQKAQTKYKSDPKRQAAHLEQSVVSVFSFFLWGEGRTPTPPSHRHKAGPISDKAFFYKKHTYKVPSLKRQVPWLTQGSHDRPRKDGTAMIDHVRTARATCNLLRLTAMLAPCALLAICTYQKGSASFFEKNGAK